MFEAFSHKDQVVFLKSLIFLRNSVSQQKTQKLFIEGFVPGSRREDDSVQNMNNKIF